MQSYEAYIGGLLFEFIFFVVCFIIGVFILRWAFRINDILAAMVVIVKQLDRVTELLRETRKAEEIPPPPVEPPPVETPTPAPTGPSCPQCNVAVTPAKPICPKCGQRVRLSRAA
jgi:hypothetical protein